MNQSIQRLKTELENADAIVIGAGAGLSASAALVRIPPGIRRGVVEQIP